MRFLPLHLATVLTIFAVAYHGRFTPVRVAVVEEPAPPVPRERPMTLVKGATVAEAAEQVYRVGGEVFQEVDPLSAVAVRLTDEQIRRLRESPTGLTVFSASSLPLAARLD